jgi:hypothetical protein
MQAPSRSGMDTAARRRRLASSRRHRAGGGPRWGGWSLLLPLLQLPLDAGRLGLQGGRGGATARGRSLGGRRGCASKLPQRRIRAPSAAARAPLVERGGCEARGATRPRNHRFLPSGDSVISTCVGRESTPLQETISTIFSISPHLLTTTSSVLLMWHSFMRDRSHLVYCHWDCPCGYGVGGGALCSSF